MPIIKLTPDFIAHNLHCPEGKGRIEYCDTELPGLYVEVRSTQPGQGTYYLRYKDGTGTTRHQKIGKTADLSLFEARKQARSLKAQIELGADPRGEERARKAVMTFDVFFEEHYLPYVKPRKRSWKRDEQLFERISPVLGKKRLTEITRQQVQTFHTDLLAEGLAHATCDHHVKLIRHALNLAIQWDFLEKNPTAGVPLFRKDNKVENYLGAEELAQLMTVLNTHPNKAVCNIAIFLLSTGARLNEALTAKWADVDMANRVWRIAATNSKSKRMRSVPLNDSALEVLKATGTQGKFDHVFVNHRISRKTGKPVGTGKPYTAINTVWERLRDLAGLPKLRIHDLRHQYASMLVNSGRSLYEVQQILGHSDPSVTTRYAHLSSKSLQEAANSASMAIKGVQSVGT